LQEQKSDALFSIKLLTGINSHCFRKAVKLKLTAELMVFVGRIDNSNRIFGILHPIREYISFVL